MHSAPILVMYNFHKQKFGTPVVADENFFDYSYAVNSHCSNVSLNNLWNQIWGNSSLLTPNMLRLFSHTQ